MGKHEIPRVPGWLTLASYVCVSARRECRLQTVAVFAFSCLHCLRGVQKSGSVDPLASWPT